MKTIKSILALAFIFCTTLLVAQDKPNVVVIMADNVGYGDISCYNLGIRGGMKTPNIDQLASEGVQMTQFLVEPGCTPTRAGFMTGQYSIRNGMSLIIAPGGSGGLDEGDFTLGKMFQNAGYNTAYAGKWHLGPAVQSHPQNQGFDQWLIGFSGTTDQVLYKENMEMLGMPAEAVAAATPKLLTADGPGEPKVIGDYDFDARLEIEGEIAKRSVKYIKKHKNSEKPFFLMVGFTRSHFPNDVNEQFKGKSGVSKYGDSMVELDYRTGEVITALKEAGLEDNTIVVWISDNGATVTATDVAEVNQGDNGPFRGELGDAYEGSIRTIGMVKWPGKIAPSRSNEMVSVHDFLPTFANIIGEEIPSEKYIDGFDQTDFFLGKQEKSNRNHLITFVGPRVAAVRINQFRIYPIIMGYTTNNPNVGGYLGTQTETAGFPQIFNIEADPKEQVDVAPTGSAWILGQYSRIISQYYETLKQHPNPPVPNMTKF